jgi:hypothetical protein
MIVMKQELSWSCDDSVDNNDVAVDIDWDDQEGEREW